MTPWRREGHHGWYFDRRSGPVYSNTSGVPVFSTGLTSSSDGFNYFTLGGKQYSVNATYVGMGCLSPALLRRLRSWQLASLGVPGAAWEMDVLPLMKIIRRLQHGCKADIAIEDKQTISALVRMGLLSASLDSPMHSAWTNRKCHNKKTFRCCQACRVTRRNLGNHKYDVVKNAYSVRRAEKRSRACSRRKNREGQDEIVAIPRCGTAQIFQPAGRGALRPRGGLRHGHSPSISTERRGKGDQIRAGVSQG
ncbi:unnamed protein product [Scytosiphon promiscuus]